MNQIRISFHIPFHRFFSDFVQESNLLISTASLKETEKNQLFEAVSLKNDVELKKLLILLEAPLQIQGLF